MPNSENIIQIISIVEKTILRRLDTIKCPILFTYEGTLLDQLAYYFIKKKWPNGDYQLVCSVRPCMEKRLVFEVANFAKKHKTILLAFSQDCIVDQKKGVFISTVCQNVTGYIEHWFQKNKGIQIVSALLTRHHLTSFLKTNDECNGAYIITNPKQIIFRNGSNNTKQLFLFKDLFPLDMIVSYLYFVSLDLELYHLPLCYLKCYNEQQQMKMREILNNYKNYLVSQIKLSKAKSPPNTVSGDKS